MSGYVPCGCCECFEIAIGEPGQFCDECIEAECVASEGCDVERFDTTDETELAS